MPYKSRLDFFTVPHFETLMVIFQASNHSHPYLNPLSKQTSDRFSWMMQKEVTVNNCLHLQQNTENFLQYQYKKLFSL